MKKLATAALCFFGAIAMAACAASENAASNKTTLEGKGYSVSLYSAEEYKTLSIYKTFTEPTGLTNHLVAAKKESDKSLVLAAWYFGSIDQANAWQEANMSKLASFYSEEQDTTIGQRNNVIWAGSKASADVLGWRNLA